LSLSEIVAGDSRDPLVPLEHGRETGGDRRADEPLRRQEDQSSTRRTHRTGISPFIIVQWNGTKIN
jgi:hypothetical protein